MTRESKRTLKAIVEMLRNDRVTKAEAEDRAREMREHMAQVMDEMHDQDWKDCDELQATWDVLNACETVLYRAARELPEGYEIDEANEEAQAAIDRVDWAEGLTDEEAARVDEDMERASNGSAIIGLQLRYQEARRIRDEREQAARDWLEEWFEGAEDPEAPVVREDEDEAPWDVARREREAKAAEDAARRAGMDHLMLIDDSNIGEGPVIEYRAVRNFWNGSDEELRELSREGYVLVTLISRDMIEEEGFGDAGENGRLDVWFRPSRQAYVPRAEFDREVERLRAEADVARAAGAKAGWEAAEAAYRNSLDYFELMKRNWKDRDDSPYPPEA